MPTATAEKTSSEKRDLTRAREMIERAYGPLSKESRARGLLSEQTTMRPAHLCPAQGRDVVNQI